MINQSVYFIPRTTDTPQVDYLKILTKVIADKSLLHVEKRVIGVSFTPRFLANEILLKPIITQLNMAVISTYKKELGVK